MSAPANNTTSVLTQTVAKVLLLPTFVTAFAILVKGYAEPGDGFSAGVVASLGVLLQYLVLGRREAERLVTAHNAPTIAGAGLLLSLSVAAVPLFLGEPVLTHFPRPGEDVIYLGTLEIITPVLFDLGIFFLVFGFAVGTISAFARTISDQLEYAGPGTEQLEEDV